MVSPRYLLFDIHNGVWYFNDSLGGHAHIIQRIMVDRIVNDVALITEYQCSLNNAKEDLAKAKEILAVTLRSLSGVKNE